MEGGGGVGVRGEREAYLKNAKITPDLQHYEEKRVDTADNLEEGGEISDGPWRPALTLKVPFQ